MEKASQFEARVTSQNKRQQGSLEFLKSYSRDSYDKVLPAFRDNLKFLYSALVNEYLKP